MRRNRIMESWNEFSRKVIHPNSPQIQRIEMRRAFYAGAAFVLEGITKDMSPGDQVQDSDIQILEDISSELVDFAEQMARGEA